MGVRVPISDAAVDEGLALLGGEWRDAPGLAARFRAARPFPHIVVDSALDAAFCRQLADQFPAFAQGNSQDENGRAGYKSTIENIRPLGPAFAQLDALLASPPFLERLGRITGIEHLCFDPDYVGGGTHENLPGQALAAHVDFNCHPRGWHRRLNLLLYLNPTWEPSWGGALELRRSPREPASPIQPLFNRAVLFETSDHSWHFFDTISAEGTARRSIAVYFYTAEPPAVRHTTKYIEPFLPETGTARDFHHLVEQRLFHLDRLLARERELLQQAANLAGQFLAAGGSRAGQERDLVEQPLVLLDELLERLYAREPELRALIARALTLPRLRLDGPVISSGQEGLWHDGWVTARLVLQLEVGQPIGELVVCGVLPPMLKEQRLTLTVDGQQHVRQLAEAGEFQWAIPLALGAGTRSLVIEAERTWQPRSTGESDDARQLAWLLSELRAQPV